MIVVALILIATLIKYQQFIELLVFVLETVSFNSLRNYSVFS
jgi:hypothetical protein